MLTTFKDMLGHARANRYAVPAFNCTEDVMVRAILETAEECRAPVILMGLGMDLKTDGGNGWIYHIGLIQAVVEHHDIPIVLHLDHTDDLELIRAAVDHGFSSVMIDGSSRPFEENVALTAAAVEIARPAGVDVEGELGHVGGMDLADTHCEDNVLTLPDEVTRFVEQTGVDALAVSIGTAHGIYQSKPTLNIQRLAELNAASPVPLVLHGGSGTPDDQVQEAVRHGICKMNVFADGRMAMYRGLKEAATAFDRPDPLPRDMFAPVKRELQKVVAEKIKLLFADGQVV
ncbi:MAG: class II fructose-bisphosphate aldolase [Planctomycetes bacterium]|nr:class II fructose-bisphosphate aldolase [Planctomycetota bacterium]